MKHEQTTLVVTKGTKVFTFQKNECELEVSGHPTSHRELKKMYPNALIREYSDTRLSTRLKAMADKLSK